MATRLMLSLKRVATAQHSVWSFNDTFQPESIRLASYTIGGSRREGGGIPLKTLSSKRMGLPGDP